MPSFESGGRGSKPSSKMMIIIIYFANLTFNQLTKVLDIDTILILFSEKNIHENV